MTQGLIVTDRDARLLYDCYQNVVLSFSEIHKRHFEKAAKQTVNNRLTRLVQGGYLRRSRVGLYLHHGKPQAIGTVFQIGRPGARLLQARHPRERFREEPVPLNTLTLYHDLLLAQVLGALRTRFPGMATLPSKLVQLDGMDRTRIPDAVMFTSSGKPEIAIELELTAKSDRRYAEITTTYQQQSLYPKVLYIVGSEGLAEKIRYPITRVRAGPGRPPPVTTRFYFVTLDALLKSPTTVPITNGTVSLQVA